MTLYLMNCPSFFFFLNDPPPPEIYTLSLHDALPISPDHRARTRDAQAGARRRERPRRRDRRVARAGERPRSEEHTSELQSPVPLVCRLLLEKKKKNIHRSHVSNHLGADSLRSCDSIG